MNSNTMIVLLTVAILLNKYAVTSTNISTFFVDYRCSKKGNYTPNSLYQYNLYNLLGTLTLEASRSGFYKASYGTDPQHRAFAFYLCRGDLGNQACSDCVIAAKNYILQKCPYQTESFIYYNECKIRFSDQSFFGKMEVSPQIVKSSPRNITGNRTQIREVLVEMMFRLAIEASTVAQSVNKKFATRVLNLTRSETLYATAQCNPDLTPDDCGKCLRHGIAQLPISCGARVLQPSCCVRYEFHPFFDSKLDVSETTNSTEVKQSSQSKHSLRVAILIAVLVPIIAILLGGGIWILTMHKKKAVEQSKFEITEIRTVECLEFDLNTIRAATNNFSSDNKLGAGGFGQVYKGNLKDGKDVAIKRLSKTSGQGIKEFKTEVVLVAKLQHKNLVKLLGFCMASKEKILVYEFLHNSSLDKFLFDVNKKLYLDWDIRFKVIVGIARGLLYLHEDSRLKIIHRDLKPSNILLDEAMNPKISDFGLAKLFGADETQGDTKSIAGTYGYMAPEYAMTGHFSAKSDVFSFGIIVLEIVSGQKNKFFSRSQQEEALLHQAWRLWKDGKGLDLVDTSLASKYPNEEISKCIHIGLLCIQENAVERPTMAIVVAALNGQAIILPLPKIPAFFGNTAAATDIRSTYYNSSLWGGNEVEYRPELDQQGGKDTYTGTTNITNLYPRS